MKAIVTVNFGSKDLPQPGDILQIAGVEGSIYWCIFGGVEIPINAGYCEVIDE